MDALQASALRRSRLVGGNVRIEATGDGGTGPDGPDGTEDQGGTLTLASTTVDTPGTLTLEADQIALATQSTRTDTRHESHGRDIAWQKARGRGTSDQATHYTTSSAPVRALAIEANRVQAGLGARDSLQPLARQPGMA